MHSRDPVQLGLGTVNMVLAGSRPPSQLCRAGQLSCLFAAPIAEICYSVCSYCEIQCTAQHE